jgi:hypothetical protein
VVDAETSRRAPTITMANIAKELGPRLDLGEGRTSKIACQQGAGGARVRYWPKADIR